MFWNKAEKILEKQVEWLHVELKRERQRADMAIDRLLELRKIPTVMPEKVVFPKQNADVDLAFVAAREEAIRIKTELESVGEDDRTKPGEKSVVEESL
jgi:uncharacterized transporter YbjL